MTINPLTVQRLGFYVASVARSRSIAARISGTTSEQCRLATASNRFAI